MSQLTSPWLEGAYGWSFGEDNWNSGMDQNLLKFSFLFDRNVDSIVASLPAAVNGQAHYNTTDNRLYFAVGTTYFSAPVPKWFVVIVRDTGQTHQFNGTSLVQIDTPVQLDSRLDAVELSISAHINDTIDAHLASAIGFTPTVDIAATTVQNAIVEVRADAVAYTDNFKTDLANTADALKGSSLVGFFPDGTGAIGRIAQTKLREIKSLQDFGAVGDGVANDTTAWNNWTAHTGGKVILPGSYLVSGIVKKYEVPTFVNSNVNSTNHAAGFQALEKVQLSAPEGDSNSAFGYRALANNTLGYRNVAVGREALFSQTGNLTTGNSNTAVGYQSMFSNTLGKDNVALGYLSMFFNTEGGGNVAVGYRALYNNIGVADTTGQFNVAIGYETLLENTQGNSNTSVGWRSMFSNTTGTRNTAHGQEALRNNVNGTNNTAVGYQALNSCVNGTDNVAIGYAALSTSTPTARNVAIGRDALLVNTSGNDGVAVGYQALTANTGGASNIGVGYRALSRNTTGASNTAVGFQSLEFTQAGGSNLAFTNCSGLGKDTRISGDNQVQLGDSLTTTYVYGTVQNRSDLRDKADITDTDLGIDFILGLRPVHGRWDMREDYHVRNEDGTLTVFERDGSKKRNRLHQWFIAQEVSELCQSLGVEFGGLQHHARNGGEDVYSLGYDEFIPPVVKAVQQCWMRLSDLESRIAVIESKP